MKFILKIFDLYAKFTKKSISELSFLRSLWTFSIHFYFPADSACHAIEFQLGTGCYWIRRVIEMTTEKMHVNIILLVEELSAWYLLIANNFEQFQNISGVWNCLEIWAVTMMSWVRVWLEIVYNKMTNKIPRHSILLLFIVCSAREKALHFLSEYIEV